MFERIYNKKKNTLLNLQCTFIDKIGGTFRGLTKPLSQKQFSWNQTANSEVCFFLYYNLNFILSLYNQEGADVLISLINETCICFFYTECWLRMFQLAIIEYNDITYRAFILNSNAFDFDILIFISWANVLFDPSIFLVTKSLKHGISIVLLNFKKRAKNKLLKKNAKSPFSAVQYGTLLR